MSFHLYRIGELYSNPSGTIQFIELTVGNINGESQWAGVSLNSSRNGSTNHFSFPSNLPSSVTANTTVLIATQGFADLGLVTPNFIVPAGFLFTAGGSLNFGNVDVISYPSLPGDGVHGVTRTGEPIVATPRNFAGATGSLPTPVVGTIMGTAGNDTLTGGLGNDTLDGGLGTDTALYSARHAAYTVALATGSTSISGPDGSDSIINMERLQFLDATLALDTSGNAGQTYRLYQAAFNRTPDLAGLGGWIAGMDSGLSLSQVANSFMASAEFQSLYGANPGNTQFVALLYSNALHRTADAGGLGYWVNQLTSNLQTRAQALVNFSESTENKASVQPLIANGILYADAAQAAGPARGQTFTGTAGADSLIGSVGNDSFNGGAGNDSLNGGAGLDMAIYSGNRSSYSITPGGSTLTVAGGTDGTDTLTNIERIRFADTALAFDTSGNAGQTFRLYQAAFNRTPDKAGLSDWIRGMDSGQSLTQVASGFIGSAEFKGLYGATPSNTQFVDLLYANVLRRAADAAGSDYWLGQMQAGTTRETVLIGFSESAENQAALIGVIQGGIAYTPG
nr:DUF4214 domain-containing protein [Rhodoferax sp.]